MPNGERELAERIIQAEHERERRIIISIALTDILWFFLDVWFVWPQSHVLALWILLGSLAGC
jgi:hypothetical protein